MNPTLARILGVIAVVAPVAIDCLSAYLNKQPVNWNLLIGTISSALGGSQLLKRAGDTSPKQVEAKVAAKVAAIASSTVPPGVQ
jgi:hypothetical protein